MSATTKIVWLQKDQDEPIPHELRSHVAVFNNKDACYQFLGSLPDTLSGLTLVVADPTSKIDRLAKLKSISSIYILSSSTSEKPKRTSSKMHGYFQDRQALLDQIRSDLSRQKSPTPGFFTGLAAPFQGLFFILRHSSTWLRALVPAIIFTILLVACAVPATWGMHAATYRLIQKYTSRWVHFGIWILRLVLYLVAGCLSLIVPLTVAQPLSGPALESLVRAQERDLNYPNRSEESFCSSVCRSFRIAVISLLLSFSILFTLTLIELFLPLAVFVVTPIKFVTTALILAYDIIDYPLSLHMLGARERSPWFRHHVWAMLGFGLAMEVIFLIPGAFILLLPAGVCGATRLVVAAERASIDQPLLLHNEAI